MWGGASLEEGNGVWGWERVCCCFTVFCVGGGIGFMNNLGLTQRAILGLN